LSVALGATIWSSRSGAQIPEDMAPRPRTALRQAHELYKRGDFENADRFYQYALAGQNELSTTERRDLATLVKQNSVALKARMDGSNLLRQAHEALQMGRAQEASNHLKAANANQYLSPADRMALTSLNEQLRGALAGGVPVPPAGRNNTTTIETGIVLQGNDAKSYLSAARQALDKGDVDVAESFLRDAEKMGSSFTWMPWGDSPTKVRRDIQAARVRQQQQAMPPVAQHSEKRDTPTTMGKVKNFLTPPWMRESDKPAPMESAARPPEFPTAPNHAAARKPGLTQDMGPTAHLPPMALPNAPKLPPAEARAQARRLIDDGYRALQANDLASAQKLALQAKALRPDLDWNERNPDRLLADVQRQAGLSNNSTTQVAGTPADARAWVRQARAMLQKDQIDEADKLCTQAAAVSGARWGLFEDSPERLRSDIQETRGRLNRERAKVLMVEARKLYGQGYLAQAKAKATEAKELHGPYSVWDFGDRPQRLLEEIARAEISGKKAPMMPNEAPAPAPSMAQGAARPPINLVSTANQPAVKQRAVLILAEARELERRGLLLEARQKAMEAEALGVSFGADEDNPRSVMLSLASKTDQRIQQLLQQAGDIVQNNTTDPARFQKAEANIVQAR
jgi:hypothetical protein